MSIIEAIGDFIEQYPHTVNLILVLIVLILIISTMYNRIRYKCLEKATELVADVEKMTELSGKEKFLLVVSWINKELPRLFKNYFIKSIIEKLVQLAYDNSKSYTENYIKRKTGYDISELISQLDDTSSKVSTNPNSESSRDN